jgi:ACS family hexuronate transporter-like MFS transporter
VLPRGPLLLAVLLVIGFGALGLFPPYYSFSQELAPRHQGKVTGSLGCICWLAMALLQEAVGESVQQTGSYTLSMTLAGLAPLLGLAALLLLWGAAPAPQPVPPPEPLPAPRSEAVQVAGQTTALP